MEDIEYLRRLRDGLKKTTDALDDLIEIQNKLNIISDDKEKEQLKDKFDEKQGLFLVQLLKIQQLSN